MVKITIFVSTLSGEKQNDDEYALKAKRVSKERPTICTATADCLPKLWTILLWYNLPNSLFITIQPIG